MLLEDSFPSINISTNQRSYQRLPADWAILEKKGYMHHGEWADTTIAFAVGQQAREVKFWESITLDLEFSRQLRKSLQIPRREERIKGLFLEVLISKRRPAAVAGHQGAGGDTETLGSTDTSFPCYKERLDFSQEFIFTLTDSEASLGVSSSGPEALQR